MIVLWFTKINIRFKFATTYSQNQRDLDLKSELTNKRTSVFVVIQIHYLNYLAAELTCMALFKCEQVPDL